MPGKGKYNDSIFYKKWIILPPKKPYFYIFVYKYTNCMRWKSYRSCGSIILDYSCWVWLEDGDKWKTNTLTAKSGGNAHAIQSKGKIHRTPKYYTLPHFTQVSFQMEHHQRDPFRTSYLVTTSPFCHMLGPYLAL